VNSDSLFETAWNARLAHFGRKVYLYAPLYISNYCVNDCLYCNFHRSNKTLIRKKLTVEGALREANAISDRGIERVTLVTGEMPWEVVGDEIVTIVREIHRSGLFRFISGNFGALPLEAFRALSDAGLDSYQIFQEVFDRKVYGKMHRTGPKSDYFLRLDTAMRALESGIPSVGIGFLLGLAPFERELVSFMSYLENLENSFPGRVQLLNFPRLRPAKGAVLRSPPFPVDDDLFLSFLARIRVAFPKIGIALTTRENGTFRNRAMEVGVTHLSVEAKTTVGGYAEKLSEEDGQFLIGDHRTKKEIAEVIRSQQLTCV